MIGASCGNCQHRKESERCSEEIISSLPINLIAAQAINLWGDKPEFCDRPQVIHDTKIKKVNGQLNQSK